MTTALPIDTFGDPPVDDIRDTILAAIVYYCANIGIDANVLPNSDYFIRAKAYAERVAIALANNQLARADINPLTAQGQALVDLAAVYGVLARVAAPATFFGIIKSNATVTIPQDFIATGPNGLKYQSVDITTRANGGSVAMIGSVGGKATNLPAGAKLTWDDASIGALNQALTVDAGGAEGGSDGDVTTNSDGTLYVERLRDRFLRKLANPGTGGNSAQLLEWAEESTSSVFTAFVFAGARYASTYDIAVTKAGGDRSLSVATTSIVAAYVAAKMPGSESGNVTSVTEQKVLVVLGATLPLPQSAGGAGGGWLDFAPWPAADVRVTGYNATTGVLTVDGTVAPLVGQSIGLWNPNAVDSDGNPAPLMVACNVASPVGGISGAWTFSVQGGLSFDPTLVGTIMPYVSAGAAQLVQYAADFATQIGLLGCGEKTTSVDLLPRARRFPGPDFQSQAALSNKLLSAVLTAHPEVEDLQYTQRVDALTLATRTAPSVPNTTADPPRILTLANLAIRQL